MTSAATVPTPNCPACSDPGARWEIVSPVAAEDRILVEPAGVTELGLFVPADGLEPLGRPVVRCGVCTAMAGDAVADVVLRAATGAGKSPRTPGDA